MRLTKYYYSQKIRHAIKTGIAAVIAALLYHFLNLPNGYWAVITAIVIMQSNIDTGSIEKTLKLGVQRFIGTLSGGLIGFIVLLLFNPTYWEMLLLMFILILLGNFLTHFYKGFNLFGATATVVILLSHHQSITDNLAFLRIGEILVGVLVAIAVTVLIWPYRAHQHLATTKRKRYRILHDQLEQLAHYLHDRKLGASWESTQQSLMAQFEKDNLYISDTSGDIKRQAKQNAKLERSLLDSVLRLGRALKKVPEAFWQFSALKDALEKLILCQSKMALTINDECVQQSRLDHLNEKNIIMLKTFDDFRTYYKTSRTFAFDIEEIYRLFTCIQTTQTISRRLNVLADVCEE